MSTLEVYEMDKSKPLLVVETEFQLAEGDLINIKRVTYRVISRSFTVDQDSDLKRYMRCNAIVESIDIANDASVVAEFERGRRAGGADALEQAARVAENPIHGATAWRAREKIAAAIRALK